MLTPPSPGDDRSAFWDAYYAYRRRVDAQRDADLIARIAAAGGRGTTCPCGYGPLDSCPICD